MSTQNNPTVPDWDKLPLPDEFRQELRKLQEDREKLKQIRAVGNAFIHYMHSDAYADTEGDYLESAFFELCRFSN